MSACKSSKCIATDASEDAVVQLFTPGVSVRNALNDAIHTLEKRSVPEPEESALHLLSHSLNLSWENGHRELRDILHLPSTSKSMLANQLMSDEQCDTFHSLIERRIQFEPLQYIIGQWDFHDLVGLKVREPMLCPRPETEELVEFVLGEVGELIQNRGNSNKRIRVLDVGCGTGAIGLAIANRYRDEVQITALDIVPEAVELSNDNAKIFLSNNFGLNNEEGKLRTIYNAILCSADEFTNTQGDEAYEMNFDIVVSNPPYIPSKDMTTLSEDVSAYESDKALCGGEDGLDVVRHIVKRLPEWTSGHCWLEVDSSHPSRIKDWLAPGASSEVECISTFKDFCGRDRFVKLRVLSEHS